MEPPVDPPADKPAPRKEPAEDAAAKKPSAAAPEEKAAPAPRRRKEAAEPETGTARARKSSPAEKEAGPPAPPKKSPGKKTAKPAATTAETDTAEPTGLSDEEKIGSAKYLSRDLPPRVFEEERFIFPETYGVNRLRLVARDPQWLFAHWDVDPGSVGELRHELGERAVAVSRLTLRITDPEAGGTKVVHVPEGSRSWYIRADSSPRSYRAELGFTLPSGEFRKVAESSTVRTPWTGTSSEKARGHVRYDRGGVEVGAPAGTVVAGESAVIIDPGPWQPEAASEGEPARRSPRAPGEHGQEQPDRGGASDTYRR